MNGYRSQYTGTQIDEAISRALNLTDELGDSTDKVMSQKATTDAINDVAEMIPEVKQDIWDFGEEGPSETATISQKELCVLFDTYAPISYVDYRTDETEAKIPEVVQETGDSETAVMSQKATTEAIGAVEADVKATAEELHREIARNSTQNIVTSKNLLTFATEFVEGHWMEPDGSIGTSSDYDYYILTLPAGSYKVRSYSSVINLTTGTQLLASTASSGEFTLTAESKIAVNSYQKYGKILCDAKYDYAEVEKLGEYTIGENVLTPKIDERLEDVEEQLSQNIRDISVGSIRNIVTTKNLLTDAEYKAGHRYTINEFTKELYEQEQSSYNYFKVKLPAGTYGFTSTAASIYNLTNNTVIASGNTDEPFTLESESVIVINSWGNFVKKLYSTEFTKAEVEARGEYTLGENVLTPELDSKIEEVSRKSELDISNNSYKNLLESNNYLENAKYYPQKIGNVDGVLSDSANYNVYILTLPAGQYFVNSASTAYNLTTKETLITIAEEVGVALNIEEESEILINSWKDFTRKLYSLDLIKATGNLLTRSEVEMVEGKWYQSDGSIIDKEGGCYYKFKTPDVASEYYIENTPGYLIYNITDQVSEVVLENRLGVSMMINWVKEVAVNSMISDPVPGFYGVDIAENKIYSIGTVSIKSDVILPIIQEDYSKYNIPVLTLSGGVNGMTKDNAVTLNYVFGERSGTCTLKWQGTSSLAYPKKNYTVKFDNKFEAAEGWGEQKKYCLKANYIDFSHSRNLVGAKLWGAIVKTRDEVTDYPNLVGSPNGGAVDGFPVAVIIDSEYMGLYTFNIPKDGWMFGMGDGEYEGIVCAEQPTENNGIVCAWESADLVLGRDYDVEYAPDEDNVEWMQTSLRRVIQACLDMDGTETRRAELETVLDVNSAIDYYIFSLLTRNYDGITKNHLLATYDGTKWMFGAYDMDCLFGMYWDGSRFMGNGIINKEAHGAFKVVATYYKDALKARYQELREDILSEENFALELTNFIGSIPKALLDEEAKIWTGIKLTSANNQSQMLEWYRRQVIKADAYINSL